MNEFSNFVFHANRSDRAQLWLVQRPQLIRATKWLRLEGIVRPRAKEANVYGLITQAGSLNKKDATVRYIPLQHV